MSGLLSADWSFYLAAVPAIVLLGLSKGGFSGLGALASVSTFAGVRLVRRVSADRFYNAIHLLPFLIGLKLAYDGVLELSA